MSDPPRVTGANGVPAYDPDFGFAFRGSALNNQSSAPPPPPAGSAGVKDPYVHLLESQSAMSMMMMHFFFAGAVRARSSDGHHSIGVDCPFSRMRIM